MKSEIRPSEWPRMCSSLMLLLASLSCHNRSHTRKKTYPHFPFVSRINKNKMCWSKVQCSGRRHVVSQLTILPVTESIQHPHVLNLQHKVSLYMHPFILSTKRDRADFWINPTKFRNFVFMWRKRRLYRFSLYRINAGLFYIIYDIATTTNKQRSLGNRNTTSSLACHLEQGLFDC